jgi:hypothetical protein
MRYFGVFHFSLDTHEMKNKKITIGIKNITTDVRINANRDYVHLVPY